MIDADGNTVTEIDIVTNGVAMLPVEDISEGVIRLAIRDGEDAGFLGFDQESFIAGGWRKVQA